MSLPRVTRSVCPECLAAIPAELVQEGEAVVLRKECPEHGPSHAVIWRGGPSMTGWEGRERVKPPVTVTGSRQGPGLGCPHDCGICGTHRQRACTTLVEVTARCNLRCPVCFAQSGPGESSPPDPTLKELETLLTEAFRRTGPVVVQLSGGEPTVRGDLPEIVALARRAGFPHVQLNTNGLRVAREPGYARALADAGLDWLFLQFDGVTDEPFTTLRGRPLLAEKLAAVEAAAQAGLGVVLAPTVAAGVNDGQLGDLVRLAASMLPKVRGVHFQPMSLFGRYPEDAQRVTLPEIMTGLETQTTGAVRAADLRPPNCEHPRCSFHGNFRVEPDGSFTPLSPPAGSCCGDPRNAALDAAGVVARQWAAVREASAEADPGGLGSFDAFLAQAATARGRTLTVTGMAFQDAWTLDLERLQGCCVHVATQDAKGVRMVPFCAWNLTARSGGPAHRAAHRSPHARMADLA